MERTGEPSAERLLGMIGSNWITQAVYVAAELRVPDFLAAGPCGSEELAAQVKAHAPSLHRLLRALATLEIVREREDGAFELLPLGQLLRSDSATSLRSWALFVGGYQWRTWGHLLESVRTGDSARKLLTGTEGFEHLERDPELAALFNQAMVEITRLICPAVVRAYDFSGLHRIADIGGGYGELLGAILEAYPRARGVLFDLPHAVEEGRRHLETRGVAGRCEFVTGSFFEKVPAGADAYLLKSVIHDWNDEKAGSILRACRRAARPESRLLLVERILPEQAGVSPADQAAARSDLNMLVSLAARERTEAEFRTLLESSGFQLERVVPAGGGYHILESFPFRAR